MAVASLKQNLWSSLRKDTLSSELEEMLISFIRNNGGKVTVPESYLNKFLHVDFVHTSVENVKKALDLLVKKGFVQVRVRNRNVKGRGGTWVVPTYTIEAEPILKRAIKRTSTFQNSRAKQHRQPITGFNRILGIRTEETEKMEILSHRTEMMVKQGKIPPSTRLRILRAGGFTQHQIATFKKEKKLTKLQIEKLQEADLISNVPFAKRPKQKRVIEREKAEFAEYMKQYAEKEGVDYVMIDIHAKKYEGFTKAEMRRLAVARGISKEQEDRTYKKILKEHKLAEHIPCEQELNRFIRDYENRVREYAYPTQEDFTIFPRWKGNRKLTKEYTCLRKAFEFCKKNGYDPANYLKAQFERFEHFSEEKKEQLKYPRPNILYSENAKRAMEIFNREHEIRENWEVDNDYGKYIHERKVGSLREELERELREVFDDFDLALKTRYKSIYRPRGWFIETVDDKYLHRENPDDFNRIVDAIYFSDYVHRAYGKVCPKLLATMEYTPEEFADADLIDSYKNNPDYYMILIETVDKLRKEYASREKDPFYMPVKVMKWKKLDQLLQSKPAHLVKSIKQLREEQGEAMKREVLARIKAEEDAKLARRKNIIERARAQRAMEQQKCM